MNSLEDIFFVLALSISFSFWSERARLLVGVLFWLMYALLHFGGIK